ncbi:O-antigen ligase family protein [Agrilactobacillus fermenti]|uniref:O-antigen ligase family protein n=1 Tax=Agrilactobacillus fermenti TaxID=2586909 RepID=UPI001E33A8C6|nr:O-antigen ligase family protein [Agrilactobacillus fermenti]MCD2255856.1 O-antigen ligase family protein [Agrilactobacillus fermenti]
MTKTKPALDLKIRNNLFFIPFILYFIYNFLQTTTFVDSMPVLDTQLLVLFGFCVGAKAIIFDHYTKQSAIFAILFFVVSVIVFFASHYALTIFICLGIIGARQIDFHKILKWILITSAALMIIAFLASMFGLIPDLTYSRTGANGKLLHSFGIIYRTDFAAHLFYLAAGYTYYKKGKLKVYDYLAFIIATGVIYYFTDTRTDAALMVLLIIGAALLQFKVTRKIMNKLLSISWLAIPILAILINVLTYLSHPNSKFFDTANRLLSGRLVYGKIGFTNYGLSPFGKYIPMQGWGTVKGYEAARGNGTINYFVLDSSYVRMLLCYGIVLFVIILLLYTWKTRAFLKQQHYLFGFIMLLIALSSFVDQHFYEFTYNFLLFTPFAYLPQLKGALNPELETSAVSAETAPDPTNEPTAETPTQTDTNSPEPLQSLPSDIKFKADSYFKTINRDDLKKAEQSKNKTADDAPDPKEDHSK